MGKIFDPFLDHVKDLDGAGVAAEDRGHLDEAAAKFEQVIGIMEVSLGNRHPQYAGAINNLATICRKQGRFEDAKALFRGAIAMVEGMAEDQPPKSVIAANIAALYWDIAEQVAPLGSDVLDPEVFEGKPEDYTISQRISLPLAVDGELSVSNKVDRCAGDDCRGC